METAKGHNRAVLIVTAIITLIFINAGIFYTSRIAKQANLSIGTAATATLAVPKLNTDTLAKLKARSSSNVDNALKPASEGRGNPFTSP